MTMPEPEQSKSPFGESSEDGERSVEAEYTTIYEAVAGLALHTDPTTGEQEHVTSHLRPDEVLFKEINAPTRYEEVDYYFAHRELPSDQKLPSGDLLSAVHEHVSVLFDRLQREGLLEKWTSGEELPWAQRLETWLREAELAWAQGKDLPWTQGEELPETWTQEELLEAWTEDEKLPETWTQGEELSEIWTEDEELSETWTEEELRETWAQGEELLETWRCLDETALLALGILLEETAKEILGKTGDLALVEAAGDREEHGRKGSTRIREEREKPRKK